MKKQIEEKKEQKTIDIEEGDLSCSYINALGQTINNCEDLPVTYCKKCKRFYVLDKEGNREEISIPEEKEYSE